MPKQINELPDFAIYVDADANGVKSVSCRLRTELGDLVAGVDVVAASQAAVAVLAGAGINLTAAQIRTVWRQLGAQSFAQAKAANGF